MDGIFNIYKEKGFTSHDVVAIVRRTIHMKKVGHTGTLDPDAEGVLPVCVGKATKLSDVIMDGRDIGTHVLPNADVKVFLTADAHVRALRRYEEFTAKGINCTLENVEREVIERDERDMNRAIAPLKQAEDAVRVDTSQMNIDEVVNCLRQLILDRI